MKTRKLVSAVLAASLLWAPLPAHAQDQQSASDHFNHGVTLYGDNDWNAALVEFQRAYQLQPTWQVLFNIGQCQFNLKRYADALVTFQKYVAQGGENIPPDKKPIVDRELADLTNRVAKITVASNLDGATVTVDDDVVGKTPITDALLVSAGTRKVTATHEGRAPVSTTISIAGGDTQPVTLNFGPPAAAQTATAKTPSSPTYVPGFVALGVGVAGIAIGGVFGAIALGNKSDLDHSCGPSKACQPDQQSNIDTLSRNATISTVGFVVGGIGLAAAIYLLVQPPTIEQGAPAAPAAAPPPPAQTTRLDVKPWLGLGSAGVSGTF